MQIYGLSKAMEIIKIREITRMLTLFSVLFLLKINNGMAMCENGSAKPKNPLTLKQLIINAIRTKGPYIDSYFLEDLAKLQCPDVLKECIIDDLYKPFDAEYNKEYVIYRRQPRNIALVKACRSGNFEEVKKMVTMGANVNGGIIVQWEAGFSPVIPGGEKGFSPLSLAAENGHEEITSFLLQNGANINTEMNFFKTTALICATIAGQIGTTRILLERGASVDHESAWGNTALILAAAGGFKEVVDLLLNYNACTDIKNVWRMGVLEAAKEGLNCAETGKPTTFLGRKTAEKGKYQAIIKLLEEKKSRNIMLSNDLHNNFLTKADARL